jgi:hypothetical protein
MLGQGNIHYNSKNSRKEFLDTVLGQGNIHQNLENSGKESLALLLK